MAEDRVFIQHRFTIEDYSDALVKTIEEYEAMTPEDIEREKQERFDNWKRVIEEASNQPVVEPTKEELQERLDAVREERVRLTTEEDTVKAELDSRFPRVK